MKPLSQRSNADLDLAAFECIPAAVFAKDPQQDFAFVFWNRAAETLFTLKESDVIGKNDFDFFPTEQARAFREMDESVISTGQPAFIPRELVQASGQAGKFVRTRKSRYQAMNSGRIYLLGVSEDVTDWVESESRIKLVLGAAHMGMWEWTLSTDVQTWDETLRLIIGFPADAPVPSGRAFSELVHPEDRDRYQRTIQEALASNTHFEYSIRILRPIDRAVRHLDTVAQVIRDSHGHPVRLMGVTLDSTASVAEAEEKSRQQALLFHSAKMATLGELASGIAHEINNPLSIISGTTTVLLHHLHEGTTSTEQVVQKLQKIDKVTHRIARVVRSIRALSRDGENEEPTRYSLAQLIEDCLELCREKFRQDQVEIRLQEVPNLELLCRPTQLFQILFNLMMNAYDAVRSLPEPWVELRADMSGGFVRIFITDCGKGIPPDIAEKIMVPFFTTKGSNGKGLGLGLSISSTIARQNQGTLTYDSSSANTRFVLKIPVRLEGFTDES